MEGLSTILNAAKQIPETLKKLGKAEMADTVLNVTQAAYDQMSENIGLKSELGDAKAALRDREDEIKKLKDLNELKANLRFENDCYWDKQGHALCSACLEKPIDPAAVRMHTGDRSNGYVICPLCKNGTWSKGSRPQRMMTY
ncbi:hypothetical protein IT413_05970 [Candidatus Peregrinibacteria bacterium]|nr:hypothetical protein [Candidatus Peregrinibacteria bacterium]